MKKHLKINCATCDARKITEEVLASYENVKINCASLIVSPTAQALMTRFGVSVNCASVTEVPEDVQLSSINGSHKITASDRLPRRTYLLINGFLEIAPGSEKALESYVGIYVNGSLTCPESLSGLLPNVTVNGGSTFYPDDAIVLKSTAVIDRLFALRAKPKLYWSERRMIMVDPQLDAAALAKKGAQFSTNEIIIAEGLVDALLPMVDERTQITIVPDGTAVIRDDVTLTGSSVKRYGSKLYILGDLNLTEASADDLEAITYLKVQGDAMVPEALRDLLLEKADIEGDLRIRNSFPGKRVADVSVLRVSQWLLEQDKHGLLVEDCALVTIDADIPNEMILEKLHLVDCAQVRCAPEQEAALGLVCVDCASISAVREEDEDSTPADDANTVKINAASYTF